MSVELPISTNRPLTATQVGIETGRWAELHFAGAGGREQKPAGNMHRVAVLLGMLRDRRLRRVELAFTGLAMAEYGVWVVMLVFGYQRGGATTAAAVAVAQLLPAGVLAPVLARAADRGDPAVVLRRGYWWQCGSLTATALLLVTGAPDLMVYVGAIVAAIAVATTRPALAALAPRLIGTDDQLTAFNVLSAWVVSFSLLAGLDWPGR